MLLFQPFELFINLGKVRGNVSQSYDKDLLSGVRAITEAQISRTRILQSLKSDLILKNITANDCRLRSSPPKTRMSRIFL